MPLLSCAATPADTEWTGQTRMAVRRSLEELLATDSPAWPELRGWIDTARNEVEVLPAGPGAGADLHSLQVTARSTLGAVVHRTGGLLVDHGWVRLLGSDGGRMARSLVGWNAVCGIDVAASAPPMLLVADDVLGGLFAIDGGGIAGRRGEVFYYAPSTLAWEGTGKGYTDLVHFLLNGDLEKFYEDVRWAGWRGEVEALPGDLAMHQYPPLWSREASEGEPVRRAVPLAEMVNLLEGPRRVRLRPAPFASLGR